MEVFRDNSPWAFTHPIGFAANAMSFNVMIFWTFVLFVFWLGELASHKVEVPAMAEDKIAEPAIAGGSK